MIKNFDFNISRAFKRMQDRRWDKIFWAIDLHDTICPADYNRPYTDFFPFAKESLQILSNRKDIGLILYTASYKSEIDLTLEWLKSNDIHFDYVNENPHCKSTRLGDFSVKFYFDVLLEDKAGFNGNTDWETIYNLLHKHPEKTV